MCHSENRLIQRISQRHHPILCILPPYMLREIAANGAGEERLDALQTMVMDQTFRTMRAMQPVPTATTRRRAAVALGEPEQARMIYDARNTQNLPGTLVRSEGQPPVADVAVNEAYDGLGDTYDLFWEEFDRNSIDDRGLPMVATVHFDKAYDNAFWNSRQMVFGDGDGKLFNRFTIALDVIGHELTHGVTEIEAGLQYFSQSGAVNESISDVFGSLVKQRKRGQTADQADWIIGEGLFTAAVQGVGIRSMKAPGTAYDDPVLGKDPQPAHMRDFVRTYEDNGGVHINSGIPNRAFYLVATSLGGFAWERAGRIWYSTLRDSQLRPNTGFKRFARLTVENAGRLFGIDSGEQKAVRAGWREVGIAVS